MMHNIQKGSTLQQNEALFERIYAHIRRLKSRRGCASVCVGSCTLVLRLLLASARQRRFVVCVRVIYEYRGRACEYHGVMVHGEVGGWGRVPLERWGAGVEYHFQEI